METIAQEAKRLLELVPEQRWCTGNMLKIAMSTCKDGPQCCGLGHWNRLHSDGQYTVESCSSGHQKLEESYKHMTGSRASTISKVNDFQSSRYSQPTPKQRVLALLDDMINAGY
jgi:hypothetical protein